VTVLEARPWLGGATCSFARRGLTIDNGQHMFLRGSVAYRDLLARLGTTSAGSIHEPPELTVLSPKGELTLRRSGLPAPLHLVRALARYRYLSRRERLAAAAAGLLLQFTEPAVRSADDDASLGAWLDRRGQDENAREMLWDLLAVTLTGVPADLADLGLAAAAIRSAMLAGRDKGDIGVPAVPLSQLHARPAAELLARLGATVMLGARAAGVRRDARGGFEIRLEHSVAAPESASPGAASGTAGQDLHQKPGLITAAAVVLAVPAWEAAIIAPAELAEQAGQWSLLQPSPVVSLHVIYADRVTRLPHAAVAGSPVRWVADKTGPAGLHAGQYLAAAIPAADNYVDLPASRLRAELLPELERLFPAAAGTEVQDFFITRERRAVVRHVPGSQQFRATQPAAVPGLALAGAWTATGLPDTMEGAVRSGHTAARKVLTDLSGADLSGAGPSPASASTAGLATAEPGTAGPGTAEPGTPEPGAAEQGTGGADASPQAAPDVAARAPATGMAKAI
jgi:squalene-associated FAD-dependent desaturase